MGKKIAKAENLESSVTKKPENSLQLSPRLHKVIHIEAAPL